MEDKLNLFYEALKTNPTITGLPKDYSQFQSIFADPNKSELFFKALKTNPTIKGLPDSYDDFVKAMALQSGGIAPAQEPEFDGSISAEQVEKASKEYMSNIPQVGNQKKGFVERTNEYIHGFGEKFGAGVLGLGEMLTEIPQAAEAAANAPMRMFYESAIKKAEKKGEIDKETAQFLRSESQTMLPKQSLGSLLPIEGDAASLGDKIANGSLNKWFDENADKLNEGVTKYDKTASQYIKSGQYGKALGVVTYGIAESLPATLAAAFVPGGAAFLGAGVGSQQYDEVKDRDDMAESMKMADALTTGMFEWLFERFGSREMGKFLTDYYKKAGGKGLKQAFTSPAMQNMIGKAYKKFGLWFAPVHEGISEMLTTLGQNAAMKYSGENPDIEITDNAVESFLIGTGMGAGFALTTNYAAKAKGQLSDQGSQFSAGPLNMPNEQSPEAMISAFGRKLKYNDTPLESDPNPVMKFAELRDGTKVFLKKEAGIMGDNLFVAFDYQTQAPRLIKETDIQNTKDVPYQQWFADEMSQYNTASQQIQKEEAAQVSPIKPGQQIEYEGRKGIVEDIDTDGSLIASEITEEGPGAPFSVKPEDFNKIVGFQGEQPQASGQVAGPLTVPEGVADQYAQEQAQQKPQARKISDGKNELTITPQDNGNYMVDQVYNTQKSAETTKNKLQELYPKLKWYLDAKDSGDDFTPDEYRIIAQSKKPVEPKIEQPVQEAQEPEVEAHTLTQKDYVARELAKQPKTLRPEIRAKFEQQFKKEHEEKVQAATQEGKEVPQNVQADYVKEQPAQPESKVNLKPQSEPTYDQKKNLVLDHFGGMYEDAANSTPEYIYQNVPEVNPEEAKQIHAEIKKAFEAEKAKQPESGAVFGFEKENAKKIEPWQMTKKAFAKWAAESYPDAQTRFRAKNNPEGRDQFVESAHYGIITDALDKGLPVPQEVLDEYDLLRDLPKKEEDHIQGGIAALEKFKNTRSKFGYNSPEFSAAKDELARYYGFKNADDAIPNKRKWQNTETIELLAEKKGHAILNEITVSQSPSGQWFSSTNVQIGDAGSGSLPSIYDIPYATKEEAIRAGLNEYIKVAEKTAKGESKTAQEFAKKLIAYVKALQEKYQSPEVALTIANDQVEAQPTEGQKEAGNYKKGHVKIQGLSITIENPAGSVRSGVDKKGNKWSTMMNNSYGYIRRTEDNTEENVDVFLGDKLNSEKVFVIDQVDPETGKYDEPKAMIGFETSEEASDNYLQNYEAGWKGLGKITEMSMPQFKEWIKDTENTKKPASEFNPTPVPQPVTRKAPKKKTENQSRIEREPQSFEEAVYQFFLSGGRVSTDALKRAISKRNKGERKSYIWAIKNDGIQPDKLNELTVFQYHPELLHGIGNYEDAFMDVLLSVDGKQEIIRRIDAMQKGADQATENVPLTEEDANYDFEEYMDEVQALGEEDPELLSIFEKEADGETGGIDFGKLLDIANTDPGYFRIFPYGLTDEQFVEFKNILNDNQRQNEIQELVDKSRNAQSESEGDNTDTGGPDTERRTDAEARTEEPASPSTRAEEVTPAFGEKNTVFSSDAANAAREVLRKKLGGQLSAGIDPETMQAGITLAGYYIEGGARKFADYAKAMISDLGEAIKPYLKSFYNAVRDWPGFNAEGMDSYEEVSKKELTSASLSVKDEADAPSRESDITGHVNSTSESKNVSSVQSESNSQRTANNKDTSKENKKQILAKTKFIETTETRIDNDYGIDEPEHRQRKVFIPVYVNNWWYADNTDPDTSEFADIDTALMDLSQPGRGEPNKGYEPIKETRLMLREAWIGSNDDLIEEAKNLISFDDFAYRNPKNTFVSQFGNDSIIDFRSFDSREKTAEELENEVYSNIHHDILKRYENNGKSLRIDVPANGKYRDITVTDAGENEVGSIKLRISNHSYNPANNDTYARSGNFISIEIANKNDTEGKYHGSYGLQFNGEDKYEDVVEAVNERVREIIDTWDIKQSDVTKPTDEIDQINEIIEGKAKAPKKRESIEFIPGKTTGTYTGQSDFMTDYINQINPSYNIYTMLELLNGGADKVKNDMVKGRYSFDDLRNFYEAAKRSHLSAFKDTEKIDRLLDHVKTQTVTTGPYVYTKDKYPFLTDEELDKLNNIKNFTKEDVDPIFYKIEVFGKAASTMYMGNVSIKEWVDKKISEGFRLAGTKFSDGNIEFQLGGMHRLVKEYAGYAQEIYTSTAEKAKNNPNVNDQVNVLKQIVDTETSAEEQFTPRDGWRDNIIKARKYASNLIDHSELNTLIREGKLDWTDKDSIVRVIDDKLAGKKTEQPKADPIAELKKTLELLPQGKKGMASYEAVKKAIPILEDLKPGAWYRSGKMGDAIMPFSIEAQELGSYHRIYEDPKAFMLIMEHNFTQMGDLMTDPRIDVAVYPSLGMVVPLNYEQNTMGLYKEYVKDGKVVDQSGLNDTHSFLKTWMNNLVQQGRTITEKDNQYKKDAVDQISDIFDGLPLKKPVNQYDNSEKKHTLEVAKSEEGNDNTPSDRTTTESPDSNDTGKGELAGNTQPNLFDLFGIGGQAESTPAGVQRTGAQKTSGASGNEPGRGRLHTPEQGNVTPTENASKGPVAQKGPAAKDQRDSGSDTGSRTASTELQEGNRGPVLNSDNHVIGPDDVVAPKGEIAKIRANIAAIKLLRKLEKENRDATPQEKQMLVQYTGWGGLASVLDEEKAGYRNRGIYDEWEKKYLEHFDKIKGLLTEDEFRDAINSTITAYYTPLPVIKSLWSLAEQFGFKGGNVLEPAAGVGHFFGLMPTHLEQNSNLRAYELDSITGRILTKLYPKATVRVRGYETSNEANGSMDLIITNVPFGQTSPYDEKNKEFKSFSLHNYFIAKGIKQLKPGGIGIFITSKSTMDSAASAKFREWVNTEGNTDFIGAIRLPNDAFKENAGTEVTSDILVFQKRTADVPGPNAKGFRGVGVLTDTVDQEGKPTTIDVNEYFIGYPDKMLGKMVLAYQVNKGGLYSGDSETLVSVKGQDTLELLHKAIQSLPKNIMETTKTEMVDLQAAQEDDKEGTLIERDGEIFEVNNGDLWPVEWASGTTKSKGKDVSNKTVASDYLKIKNLAKELLDLELTSKEGDQDVEQKRRDLNRTYDSFVSKYGTFNRNSKIDFLEDDSEYNTVSALEDVITDVRLNKNGGAYKVSRVEKSDILRKRVSFPVTEPSKAESPEDALNISISYRGRVDVDYISSLLGIDADKATDMILEKGLAFVNPATGLLEDKDTYLSGLIRTKLRLAEAEAERDEKYRANVDALKVVLPKEIPAQLIKFKLGSNWIPEEVYEKFIQHNLGVTCKVHYNNVIGSWTIDVKGGSNDAKNISTYATEHFTGIKLVDKAMNLRQPTVFRKEYDYASGKYTEVKDPVATAAAQGKMDEIADLFQNWLPEQKELTPIIEKVYNERYNDYVDKKYSKPYFDYYPGANRNISLREHQNKAVGRSLKANTLLAHGVGTGKTFTMITTAMEMRRLGVAKKPLIVVQNSTVEQFASEFRKLYPAAKLLVPSKTQRDAKNRQKTLNKIAYGDWDAVIIPQSFLNFIPDDPARERAYIQERIEELRDVMNDADDGKYFNPVVNQCKKEIENLEEALDKLATKRVKASTVKEKAKKGLKTAARLQSQMGRRKDDVVMFEKMGVDALFIDEAHAFKKLGFATKMTGVRGIDTKGSQRAMGLNMKVRFIREKMGGRNVIFSTGTPVTNTMAEVWTMMKYLTPDLLDQHRIGLFDAFATTFGNVEPSLEFNATGTFKVVNRFKSYINAPELMKLFRASADVVLSSDVREFKEDNTLPKLKGGSYTGIVLPQTEQLTQQMDRYKRILLDWDNLTGKEKRAQRHVPLVIFGKAKQAAIDLRLVDPNNYDDPGSKTNRVVKEALRLYKETEEYKGAQLIFSDMYQSPKRANNEKRFNLYEEIKKKLIEGGVKESEIEILKDQKDTALEGIFIRVNSGEIRVLLGSTERMGVGVNVQERLAALHHVDAPARPMDFEQRNGRILRQGNTHAEMGIPIEILTYGVEKTLDATAYQRLDIKQKFINQVMKAEDLGREMEDSSDEDVSDNSFGVMMGQLSGDQTVILLKQKEHELRKLETAKRNHERGLVDAAGMLKEHKLLVEGLTPILADMKKAEDILKEQFPDHKITSIMLNGKKYTDHKEATEAFDLEMMRYADRVKTAENVSDIPTYKLRINDLSIPVQIYYYPVTQRYEYNYDIMPDVSDRVHLTGRFTVGAGFFTSWPSQVKEYPKKAIELSERIETYKKNIPELESSLTKSFAKEDKLAQLKEEVAALEAKLTANNKEDVEKLKDVEASMDDINDEINNAEEESSDDSVRFRVTDDGNTYNSELRDLESKIRATSKARDAKKRELAMRIAQQNDLFADVAEGPKAEQATMFAVAQDASIDNIKRILSEYDNTLAGLQDAYDKLQATLATANKENAGQQTLFRISEDVYFSPVEKAVDAVKQDKGTPQQWKAMLLKNGAKQAELDWMGWDDFTEGKTSIIKTEIQKWIADNKINIKEVTLGLNNEEREKVKELTAPYTNDDIVSISRIPYSDKWDILYYLTSDHQVTAKDEIWAQTEEEAREAFLESLNNDTEDRLPEHAPKYERYTLHGGEDYRELLLTMPEEEIREGLTPALVRTLDTFKYARDTYGENSPEYKSLERHFIEQAQDEGLSLEDAQDYIKKFKTKPRNFITGHFAQPNILAHVRFNSRRTDDGRSVLFIEEIQSDWAQRGKKEGFKRKWLTNVRSVTNYRKGKDLAHSVKNGDHNSIKKMASEMAAIIPKDALLVPTPGRTGKAINTKELANEIANINGNKVYDVLVGKKRQSMYEAKKSGHTLSINELGLSLNGKIPNGKIYVIDNVLATGVTAEAIKSVIPNAVIAVHSVDEEVLQSTESERIPDMPFKQTDQWAGLVLRRMIRYAIDNGFDAIAWTPGQVQAERYDISRQLDTLRWIHEKDGTYSLIGKKNGRQEFEKNVPASELESWVGKEIAGKITEEKSSIGELKGEGLRVGGKGMIGFYDNILPSIANKIGKKFGSQVAEGNITIDKRSDADRKSGGRYTIEDDVATYKGYGTIEEAEAALEKIKAQGVYGPNAEGEWRIVDRGGIEGIKVHALPITDQMMNTYRQGVPLFRTESKKPQSIDEVFGDNKERLYREMRGRIELWASKLKTPIEAVENRQDLPANLLRTIEKRFKDKRVSGIFDPVTDKVYVVMSEVKNMNEIPQVIFHELVAHYGLKDLLGDNYTDVLNDVYDSMTPEEISRLEHIYKTNNRLVIADEYLAHMAEMGVEPNLFRRIIAKIRQLIRRIFKLNYSVNDIHSMLLESRRNLEKREAPKPRDFETADDYIDALTAYHGTPHGNIRRFKTSRIGTGEGNQMFGYGLYFTDLKEVAEFYAKSNAKIQDYIRKAKDKIGDASASWIDRAMLYNKWDHDKVLPFLERKAEKYSESPKIYNRLKRTIDYINDHPLPKNRYLYQVLLHKGKDPNSLDFVRFDQPLSDKQTVKIADQMRKEGVDNATLELALWSITPSSEVYRLLVDNLGAPKAASMFLARAGIDGIKYPVGSFQSTVSSNVQQSATSMNYVIFNDRDVSIEQRYRFKINDPTDEKGPETPDGKEPSGPPKNILQKKGERRVELWQNRMLSVREWQNRIRGLGGKITEISNPYRQENLSHGMVKSAIEKYDANQGDALLKAASQLMMETGMSYSELNDYMQAKFAPYVNKSLEEKTGRDVNSGMTTEEANEITEKWENKAKDKTIASFWKAKKNATDYTLQRAVNDGLMSQETYKKITEEEGSEYYVPLRGWKETEQDAYFLYMEEDAGETVNPIRKRRGRKSRADDPMQYIFSMAHTAIVVGEKNRIKQHAARLIRDNKEMKDLHRFKKVYAVWDGTVDETTGKKNYVDVYERPAAELWEQGFVKMKYDLGHFKGRSGTKAREHETEVFIGGEKFTMVLPADVANALNKTPSKYDDVAFALREAKIGQFTRWLSSNFTSKNPVFIPINQLRDLQYATLAHFVKGDTKEALRFMAVLPKARKAIIQHLNGKGDPKDPVYQMYLDFMRNGGETGYVHLKDVDQLAKEIKKELSRLTETNSTFDKTVHSKVLRAAGEWMEHMAIRSENLSRFATYLVSKEQGKTDKQAAFDAKEITVNFNRKGRISGMMGAMYAFFNASVQGGENIIRMGKEHTGKFFAIGAAGMAMGFLGALFNSLWGGDDDDDINRYDQINDYLKYNNMIIMVPGAKRYISIPLPHGFRWFNSLGVLTYQTVFDKKNFGAAVKDGVSNAFSSLSPVNPVEFIDDTGALTSRPLWPTFTLPFYDIAMNETYTGAKVHKEPFTQALDGRIANSALGMDNVNTFVKGFTDFMFKIGGGDPATGAKYYENNEGQIVPVSNIFDQNPSDIEHVIEYYLGGRGMFWNDVIKTAQGTIEAAHGLATDESFGEAMKDINMNTFPVVKALIRQPWKESVYTRYYDVINDIENYRSMVNLKNKSLYLEQEPEEYTPEYQYKIDLLSDLKKDLKSIDEDIQGITDPKEVEELKEVQELLIRNFLDAIQNYNAQ